MKIQIQSLPEIHPVSRTFQRHTLYLDPSGEWRYTLYSEPFRDIFYLDPSRDTPCIYNLLETHPVSRTFSRHTMYLEPSRDTPCIQNLLELHPVSRDLLYIQNLPDTHTVFRTCYLKFVDTPCIYFWHGLNSDNFDRYLQYLWYLDLRITN